MTDKKKPTFKKPTKAPKALVSGGEPVTLRSGSERTTVPWVDAKGKTVRALFGAHQGALGYATDREATVRESGFLIAPDAQVEEGKTYLLSVDRETKGSR